MAAIDNGTIILKNRKLLEIPDPDLMGDDEVVNGICFHSDLIMEKAVHEQMTRKKDYDVKDGQFYMNLWEAMRQGHKRVLYWTFNGTHYKTKRYIDSAFLTTFSVWNDTRYDFYQVLQGYDVSIYGSYTKHMAHALEKFSKYQRKIYVIPHVFY